MIRPVVASVVGQVSDTKWGQVLQTPHAYGVVEINTPDPIARQKGIELLTKLTKQLVDPPVSLAVLEEIADDVMTSDVASLLLLVLVGSVCYLVSRGEGKVYLKRGSKLAVLVADTQSLSGEVQTGDTIVAATAGFARVLPPEDIIGVFDHLAPAEVAEKLTMLLHERDGGDGGAALIFHVTTPEKSEEVRDAAPVLSEPPKVARAVMLGKVKAFGRRYTTIRQRATLRRAMSFLQHPRAHTSPRAIIAYVFIILFVISVVLGIRKQLGGESQTKTSAVIAEAQYAFDTGMQLLDLNPVKGRENLTHAKDLLAPLVAKKPRSQEAKKAAALYDQIVENLTAAMHIVRGNPELFFDAALLKNGATISDMSFFHDSFGLLDTKGQTIFALDAASKNGSIAAGGELYTGAAQIAAYSDKLYVFTPKGIHAVRLNDKKTVEGVIPKAEEWGNIADMVGFGGNLYLLDTTKSRIWKYVATEKGFSELREYLNPDAFPDLSHATNMTIDGSVWLGTNNGAISRFTMGKENSFAMQGVDTALGKHLIVFTDDETKSVYVLDSDNHRIVVFDKDGFYLSQYIWDNGTLPTAFAVSEKLGKIFLLVDGKLYALALK